MNGNKIKKGLRIRHSLLFLALIIFMTTVSGVLSEIISIGDSLSLFISCSLTFGVSLIISVQLYQHFVGKFDWSMSNNHLVIIPFLLPLPILLQFGVSSHLTSMIPMPEMAKEYFYALGMHNSFLSYFTIVILASVLEEIICRGIILKGLLKRHNPIISILVSSLLFGIMHLNPWQFVGAFFIGVVNGWLFWRTENIILPIVVHFSNNLFFTFFGAYFGISYVIDKPIREVFGSPSNQWLFSILSIVLLIISMSYLQFRFKSKEPNNSI